MEFKVGDECWMFYTTFGSTCWSDSTIIYPEHTELMCGTIVNIDPPLDEVYIFIKGEKELVSIGLCFFDYRVFKTKNKAIEAMLNRLEELKNE